MLSSVMVYWESVTCMWSRLHEHMLMESAPRTYAHGAGLLRFREHIYMLAEAAPPASADVPASMSTGSRTRHHDHKIMAPAP